MRALSQVRAGVLALTALVAGAALPAGGCSDAPTVTPCGEIPAGGCPHARGGTCEDPACAGLYDCVDGSWTRALECSADGGSDGGDGGDAGPGPTCSPVTIAHVGEVTGCKPDLQNPDCPVAAAETACRESACLTGCLDFFLCTKAGWTVVASCDEQGDLSIVP
jgi:hypothetical protein